MDKKAYRTLAYTAAVDGAVHVAVLRPDGTEATCYAKNVRMKGGRAVHEIPFVPSDPKGTWKVRVTSIFGGACQTCTVVRR